jgi:hypothetical protein
MVMSATVSVEAFAQTNLGCGATGCSGNCSVGAGQPCVSANNSSSGNGLSAQTSDAFAIVGTDNGHGNGVGGVFTSNGTGNAVSAVAAGYESASGYAISANSYYNTGVYATGGGSGYGIYATAANDAGHFVSTGSGHDGVYADSGSSGVAGVYATGNEYGVYATSAENTAGEAAGYFDATSTGSDANAVAAVVAGTGTGVYARTYDGYGVYAIDQGTSGGGTAMYGLSDKGTGIYGESDASGGIGVYGDATASNGYAIYGYNNGASGYAGYFNGRTNTTGCIQYNGTNEFGCSSDRRLKKDIKPISGALEALLRLKGVTYDWIKPEAQGRHAEERQTGFIAQDVEGVFPNWVDVNKDGYKTLMIQPNQVTALEVESIRELKTQHDEDLTRIKKLEERLDALQNGRDPITGGVGVGRGTLLFAGLGILGLFGASRRKRAEKQA